MKYILPRIVLGLACLSQIVSAENKGPQTVAELQKDIEKVLRETGTPGAAVAIVSRDKIEWIAGLGLADVAMKKPVTTSTVFRIASISKEFAALAVLKLQEEGKLKLTDTLRQWVPEHVVENQWEATDPVRLVHLLEHTSGLPDCRFSEYAHNDPTPVTLAQALAFAPQNRVTRWRPGSRFAYSSEGPPLVAAVVEKVSGQRFEDYVRDNFFALLGMKKTSYFLTPTVQANLATMYWSGNKKVAPYTHFIYRAATSVNASVEDMANYVRFHLQRGRLDGRKILSEASIDRLELPTTLPSAQAGMTTGYGLYNQSKFDRGYEWHGHSGEWDAALSRMFYCPELGCGLVIMINTNDGLTINQILRLVVGYLERDVPEKTLPAVAPMPAVLAHGYDGYYANIAPRDEGFADFREYFLNVRRVHVDEKGMTWRRALGGPTDRWLAVSDKLFRRENAAKPAMALITGEKGEPLFQFDDGTYQRTSGFGFWFVFGGVPVSILLVLTALPFALIWGLRKALGRLKNPGPLSLRVWQLVGAVGVFGFIAFYANVQEGCIDILGTLNFWSVGLMLDTLLIPLTAICSVVAVWRHRKAPMNRVAYWYAVLVTLGLVFISGFFLTWGMIGLRTWA
jgi:CubicO group peptidase (beta-lactamase class C family)